MRLQYHKDINAVTSHNIGKKKDDVPSLLFFSISVSFCFLSLSLSFLLAIAGEKDK